MGFTRMVRGQHSDLCFGNYTSEIGRLFKRKKDETIPDAQVWQLVFGENLLKLWDSRRINQANVQINNTEQSEFVIQGQSGMYLIPNTMEVDIKVIYANTQTNADVKTHQRSGDIDVAVAFNGSERFFGYSQDSGERNATHAAIEMYEWAEETAYTPEEIRAEAQNANLLSTQKKSLPQVILRDSASTGASKTKLVTGKYFEGAYATLPDPATAHNEGDGAAHHVSAKWNLRPAPGYVSATNNNDTVDANNPVRTYKVHDCMNTDVLNTSALIPAHNDTKIRMHQNATQPR